MHKSILTFICLVSILKSFAQTDSTVYYITLAGNFTDIKDSADIVRYVLPPLKGEREFIVHDYYADGNLKQIAHATNKNGTLFQGYSIEFSPKGIKKTDCFYKDNNLLGPFTTYYPDGKLHIAGMFDNFGQVFYKQCRDRKGNVTASDGNGEVMEFDADYNFIIDRGNIKKGIRDGKWTFFNRDTLKYSLYYIQGNVNGGIGYDNAGKEYPFTNFYDLPRFKKTSYCKIL